MAGNNVVAPARGTVLATDNIDEIHYPIDKIAFGAEDEVTLVSPANPLPTGDAAALAKLTSILAKLISSPATEATLASCLTQLQILVSEDAGLATASGQASALTALAAVATAVQGTLAISAASLPLPAGAATQTTSAAILAKLSADPATQATLEAVRALLAGTLAISAAALPLPTGAATQTTLAAVLAAFSAGQKASSTSLSVVTSKDQDPIFDHANGTKSSVTTSATIITPPAGCNYLRISSDVDIFVNTANAAAVDDGTSIRIVANTPEVIPVVAATAVKALSSSGTATVRCTPLKTR